MRSKCAAISLLSAFTVLPLVIAQSYKIKDTFIGHDFFDSWVWYTADDLTHGRVNYVDQETARRCNLSYASESKFVMRADDSQIVPEGARGRDSIRITSNAVYDDAVFVLDLTHMPQGCSTWPAFWTLSAAGPWPQGGEIDIIEGTNLLTDNIATLHTLPGCTMAQTRNQKGTTESTNCDTAVAFNLGCGTKIQQPNSYGSGFNGAGGGYYAMQKAAAGINVWFWPRDAVPDAVQHGSRAVEPASWGPADAAFTFESCNYEYYFHAHQMIFDLTFCGDMAGALYPTTPCAQKARNCTQFVDKNPGAFSKAYWEINSLRVYTPDC